MMEKVIKATIPAELLDENTKYYINPTGRFVVGGPQGDSGLTGRKIIVDTYGGYARHGGGAFSGKDPSKVDRSAAYAARWVAKNIVAAGLAKQCEVQVAYAIGVAKPVSIMVDTFGTGTVADEKIEQAVEKVFDLTPAAIIRDLDLRKPIYRKLAAYGHMGREELGVKWENTDRVESSTAASCSSSSRWWASTPSPARPWRWPSAGADPRRQRPVPVAGLLCSAQRPARGQRCEIYHGGLCAQHGHLAAGVQLPAPCQDGLGRCGCLDRHGH